MIGSKDIQRVQIFIADLKKIDPLRINYYKDLGNCEFIIKEYNMIFLNAVNIYQFYIVIIYINQSLLHTEKKFINEK